MTTDYILRRELQKVLDLLTEQNRLVMEVALVTGLRVGDVLALRADKIGRQFWIVEQKTGKRRRVNLPEALVDKLRANAQGGPWVFPGRDGPKRHRTRQAVWADVKRAQKAFRMAQNLGTHTARKVYAVELMERYGDVGRVKRALNHSDMAITSLYAMADVLTRRRLELRAARQARRRAARRADV